VRSNAFSESANREATKHGKNRKKHLQFNTATYAPEVTMYVAPGSITWCFVVSPASQYMQNSELHASLYYVSN
jgi:hypothetical protein